MLISAGNSPAGRAFAARHADCLFMTVNEIETLAGEVDVVRAAGGAQHVGIFASGHMITRPTRKEAEDYYHYIVYDMGDWEAAEHTVAIRMRDRKTIWEHMQRLKERMISGLGTYPVVGSYDDVAETFSRLREAGLDGMAIGMVNYIDEFPILRDEVLPRMERLGLRRPLPPPEIDRRAP